MVASKEQLLALPPSELIRIKPSLVERPMDQEEIEAIFKACYALWVHPGDRNPRAPHAILTSGKHSNGYINCLQVLCPSNLCQIMASQVVILLRSVYDGPVDWVVGSDSAALGLSKDVANTLDACWHPMQKGPDKAQLWEKMVIPAGAKVLHVEELMTTALTSRAVREGIRQGNPNSVEFVPFLPVLIHRPAPGEGQEVDGSRVIYLLHYDISVYEPDKCPLCQAGSEVLKPKGENWQRLVSTM